MNRPEPTHERIQELAYLLWEAAGSPPGRDDEFWAAAVEQAAGQSRHDPLAPEMPPAHPVQPPLTAICRFVGEQSLLSPSEVCNLSPGQVITFPNGWELKMEPQDGGFPLVRMFQGCREVSIDPAFADAASDFARRGADALPPPPDGTPQAALEHWDGARPAETDAGTEASNPIREAFREARKVIDPMHWEDFVWLCNGDHRPTDVKPVIVTLIETNEKYHAAFVQVLDAKIAEHRDFFRALGSLSERCNSGKPTPTDTFGTRLKRWARGLWSRLIARPHD